MSKEGWILLPTRGTAATHPCQSLTTNCPLPPSCVRSERRRVGALPETWKGRVERDQPLGWRSRPFATQSPTSARIGCHVTGATLGYTAVGERRARSEETPVETPALSRNAASTLYYCARPSLSHAMRWTFGGGGQQTEVISLSRRRRDLQWGPYGVQADVGVCIGIVRGLAARVPRKSPVCIGSQYRRVMCRHLRREYHGAQAPRAVKTPKFQNKPITITSIQLHFLARLVVA